MKKYFYPLIKNPFRKKDLLQAIKVLKSNKITAGKVTANFEKVFKRKLKINQSLMVNSGSSANLLAFQCLVNPYRKRILNKNDEVLIPTLCWSTSLWPIVQSGLKPVFVDVDIKTLNINTKDMEKKINKKTKVIMLVHVLGNSTNMDEILRIKKKYNLILIEDTCESLGTKYKNKYLGALGEFSSFSFYVSHQITSGEGGMICCKDVDDMQIIKSLRAHGWSRGLKNEKAIAIKNRDLDPRFIFYNSGFNLRPTDITASIGLSQFKDLDKLVKTRNLNRDKIYKAFLKNKIITSCLSILKENKFVKPSWFGMPIMLNRHVKKDKFINKLENLGVETRPIISGNFLKQPSIKKYKIKSKVNVKNSNIINKFGLFIGLPINKITSAILNKLVKAFEKSL
mgnify:FL=1